LPPSSTFNVGVFTQRPQRFAKTAKVLPKLPIDRSPRRPFAPSPPLLIPSSPHLPIPRQSPRYSSSSGVAFWPERSAALTLSVLSVRNDSVPVRLYFLGTA